MRKEWPKDEDIDASFFELKDSKTPQALERLGIEESDTTRKPLVVFGNSANFTHQKQGDDGLVRLNPMEAEIIHFGKNQLFINSVNVDLINPDEYVGRTNEFFYKDISAVSIQDERNSKRFIIKVHGEAELDVGIYKSPEAIKEAEEAVSVIRKFLREAKN